jgi:hypothetical protein
MKQIEVSVQTDRICSKVSTVIEVEDDLSEDEIDNLAQEAMFGLIEWTWKPL